MTNTKKSIIDNVNSRALNQHSNDVIGGEVSVATSSNNNLQRKRPFNNLSGSSNDASTVSKLFKMSQRRKNVGGHFLLNENTEKIYSKQRC